VEFHLFIYFNTKGTANRTVASTQMNATSSRAHTVVTIQFDQIEKNAAGEETKKSSVVNLVDLAGKYGHFYLISGITKGYNGEKQKPIILNVS